MLHIALFQPEIPPNTGNIIRLCANTKTQLHLIHPLGFELNDKRMRRAGLDYHEFANVIEHENYESFSQCVTHSGRIIACSTKGHAYHHEIAIKKGDCLLFGPETRGLPAEVLQSLPQEQVIRIPMHADSRSLNLSNSVAVILYEGLRQLGFEGLI